MTVIYEDNHIIVVNKAASEIVQGDKTGDTPLSETVKQYLKEKYAKPGNVFIGVTHRPRNMSIAQTNKKCYNFPSFFCKNLSWTIFFCNIHDNFNFFIQKRLFDGVFAV